VALAAVRAAFAAVRAAFAAVPGLNAEWRSVVRAARALHTCDCARRYAVFASGPTVPETLGARDGGGGWKFGLSRAHGVWWG
jgi:hypothetical protein